MFNAVTVIKFVIGRPFLWSPRLCGKSAFTNPHIGSHTVNTISSLDNCRVEWKLSWFEKVIQTFNGDHLKLVWTEISAFFSYQLNPWNWHQSTKLLNTIWFILHSNLWMIFVIRPKYFEIIIFFVSSFQYWCLFFLNFLMVYIKIFLYDMFSSK